MSGAKVQKNAKKQRHNANITRPNGCSDAAISGDPRALIHAAMYGNRATRREATRNLWSLVSKRADGRK